MGEGTSSGKARTFGFNHCHFLCLEGVITFIVLPIKFVENSIIEKSHIVCLGWSRGFLLASKDSRRANIPSDWVFGARGVSLIELLLIHVLHVIFIFLEICKLFLNLHSSNHFD